MAHDKSLREVLEACKYDTLVALDLKIDTKSIDKVLELLTLRELIKKDESQLPDKATCKKKVVDVLIFTEYLAGLVNTGLAVLLNPSIYPDVYITK